MATRRAKGEGTICRRKDGLWEGKVSCGKRKGKPYRLTFYARTKGEVKEKMRAAAARLSPKLAGLRVKDHLPKWLEEGKSRWEPQTYRTYETLLRLHVIPYLGEREIETLTSRELRAWQQVLADNRVGKTTRKRALTTLRSALKQLVKDEVLSRNPADVVDGPKLTRSTVEIPEPVAIKRILEVAESVYWLYCFALVAFTCTLRQGELFALWWSQIDFAAGSIFVDKSLAEDWDGTLVRKTPKTKYSIRTVFMPKITIQALKELKKLHSRYEYNAPWIFPDSDGGPMRKSNFDRRFWAPLLKKAGVGHFKFHATRHAGNSLLIQQGEDPVALSRRMGHADSRMTLDTYGHLFSGSGRVSAKRMDDAFNDAGIGKNPRSKRKRGKRA